MTKIIEIEGIGEKYAAALEGAGIATVEALLDTAGSASDRQALAEKTGVTPQRVLEWVNRADLMRIKGVGSEYSDLLEAAGVDTVKELATRRPDNLHAKLEEVNAAKSLVRRTPTAAEVEKWVAEAKTLPQKVTHWSPWELGGTVEPNSTTITSAVASKRRQFENTQANLDLLSEAATIFGSIEDALAWLDAPNRSIGGATPRGLCQKGVDGVAEARDILFLLEEGIFS
ncbi:MAG: DUF4332 domain-containing protein [Dehalococcoidia bacterium]|nr:DUF4332 domain-containing protein [Dehalococcoidia bacterium]